MIYFLAGVVIGFIMIKVAKNEVKAYGDRFVIDYETGYLLDKKVAKKIPHLVSATPFGVGMQDATISDVYVKKTSKVSCVKDGRTFEEVSIQDIKGGNLIVNSRIYKPIAPSDYCFALNESNKELSAKFAGPCSSGVGGSNNVFKTPDIDITLVKGPCIDSNQKGTVSGKKKK